jgi:hypothetical protein
MLSPGSGLTKLGKIFEELSFLAYVKPVSAVQRFFFIGLVNPNPGDNTKSRDDRVFWPD